MKSYRPTRALLARNSLLNFVGQVVPLAAGIVLLPVLVRGLGADRFGLLSLAWVVLGYFTLFDLGLGRAATKYVAEALGRGEPHEVPAVAWTVLAAQSALGLVAAAALWLSTPIIITRALTVPGALVAEATATFYWLAISTPVMLIFASLSGFLEAGQRFELLNPLRIVSGLIPLIAPVMVMTSGGSLADMVAVITLLRLGLVVALVGGIVLAFPGLRWAPTVRWRLVPGLLGYGGWITTTALLTSLMDRIDRFFIGRLLSIGAVTYFAVPQGMLSQLWIVPHSLTPTLFPALSTLRAGAEQNRIPSTYVKALQYVAALTVPVTCAAFLFAPELLRVWMGQSFADRALDATRLMAAGAVVAVLTPVPITVLQALGRPDLVSKVLAIQFLYPIALWMGIRAYGLPGAAGVLGARAVVQAVLMLRSANRLIPLAGRQTAEVWETFGIALGAMLVAYLLVGSGVWIKGLYVLALSGIGLLVVRRDIKRLLQQIRQPQEKRWTPESESSA